MRRALLALFLIPACKGHPGPTPAADSTDAAAPTSIATLASASASASAPASASAFASASAELPPPIAAREPENAKVRVTIAGSDPAETRSFHGAYFGVFRRHAPVYVTADVILHPWHESYDRILMDLETSTLAPAIEKLLGSLRERLATMPPSDARADLDTFLTAAARLITDRAIAPAAGGDEAAIASIVQSGKAATGPGTLALFGTRASFDYSMMKPRGHYTKSPLLSRYFRAVSLLGRAEIRIAERGAGAPKVNRSALAAATLLRAAFGEKEEADWRAIDATLNAFVGPQDSLSPFGADLAPLASADDETVMRTLAEPAKQRIGTQLRMKGESSVAMTFLGQRYVFDSEVLGRVSYGELRAKRMMPSPLDVATVVFGNPTANALLAPERAQYGAEYTNALATLTKQRDDAGDALWKGSLHHLWLGALRELSPNAKRDAGLPDPFLSEAWNRRLLNTQLASWAELRHDNILYAKQSVSGMAACEYPYVYVDPYPSFFAALEEIATRGAATLAGLPWKNPDAAAIKTWFEGFGKIAARLRAMAERERKNEELTTDDVAFVNRMVSISERNTGCTKEEVPGGWLVDLYYGASKSKILDHEPIIADIHTQPTDADGNSVGRVLHVGTGMPRMMRVTIAHDGAAHPRTYEGVVSTYAETTTNGFKRFNDEEWRAQLRATHKAPTPLWIAPAIGR